MTDGIKPRIPICEVCGIRIPVEQWEVCEDCQDKAVEKARQEGMRELFGKMNEKGNKAWNGTICFDPKLWERFQKEAMK